MRRRSQWTHPQEGTPLPTTRRQRRLLRRQGAKAKTPTTTTIRQKRKRRQNANGDNVEIIDKILT